MDVDLLKHLKKGGDQKSCPQIEASSFNSSHHNQTSSQMSLVSGYNGANYF